MSLRDTERRFRERDPTERGDSERLREMMDEEIRAAVAGDPDTFVPDETFWQNARVTYPVSAKDLVPLRVGEDVLAWFRDQGEDFRERMSAVLRSHMEAHRGER